MESHSHGAEHRVAHGGIDQIVYADPKINGARVLPLEAGAEFAVVAKVERRDAQSQVDESEAYEFHAHPGVIVVIAHEAVEAEHRIEIEARKAPAHEDEEPELDRERNLRANDASLSRVLGRVQSFHLERVRSTDDDLHEVHQHL